MKAVETVRRPSAAVPGTLDGAIRGSGPRITLAHSGRRRTSLIRITVPSPNF